MAHALLAGAGVILLVAVVAAFFVSGDRHDSVTGTTLSPIAFPAPAADKVKEEKPVAAVIPSMSEPLPETAASDAPASVASAEPAVKAREIDLNKDEKFLAAYEYHGQVVPKDGPAVFVTFKETVASVEPIEVELGQALVKIVRCQPQLMVHAIFDGEAAQQALALKPGQTVKVRGQAFFLAQQTAQLKHCAIVK